MALPRPAAEPVATAADAVTDPDSLPSPPSDRTPPFRSLPLVIWGAPPPGERRAERARTYDLQHQIVRLRFAWDRRAVIGSTTLRVAPLPLSQGGTGVLSSVALDAVGMTIGEVRGPGGAVLRHDYDGRTLVVHLASPLRGSARTTITVDYESVRPTKGVRFSDSRRVVWTEGETEQTRHWVPTYDHPHDKATWEILVRTSRGERALSNGRLAASHAVGDEVEWHWVVDRPASTYLMSVVAGQYLVLVDKWRDVPLGYWTYPDSIAAAWRGFGATPRAVDIFSARTGVKYPWAKYDQSVVPADLAGGMANVSGATHSDDRVLHPRWAEPQANADELVAHELAHQWYGSLVTARDWTHAWLNEGFATFLEQVFLEEDRGRDEASFARLRAQEEALAADLAARRPLVYDRWVTGPIELFGAHVSSKGASVLQTLRRQLGDPVFWSGMNRYTTRHAYGVVVTDDFRRAMEEAAGRELAAFFDQWVEGAGFPAFRVAFTYDPATSTVTIVAEQVQPREMATASDGGPMALEVRTGLFAADVDIGILTDSGAVHGLMAVAGPISRATFAVRSPPRAIRWDRGGWLLDVADFPRPTVMLAHQLEHDDDVIGRIEAAVLLRERLGEPTAVNALAAAVSGDSFWGVRARAATALGNHRGQSPAIAALDRALSDGDARVRQAAATALGSMGASTNRAAVDALRRLAGADSSLYVRGAAMRALARLAPEIAIVETIIPSLGRDSWLDMERTNAMSALAMIPVDRAQELVPRLLDHGDMLVRQAAATTLGRLADPAGIGALEARRAVEAESRVRDAIDAALAALRATGRSDP